VKLIVGDIVSLSDRNEFISHFNMLFFLNLVLIVSSHLLLFFYKRSLPLRFSYGSFVCSFERLAGLLHIREIPGLNPFSKRFGIVADIFRRISEVWPRLLPSTSFLLH
jgi:hypothetical protein